MFCCDAGLLKSFLCKNIQVFIKADKNKPTLILSSLKLSDLEAFSPFGKFGGECCDFIVEGQSLTSLLQQELRLRK